MWPQGQEPDALLTQAQPKHNLQHPEDNLVVADLRVMVGTTLLTHTKQPGAEATAVPWV